MRGDFSRIRFNPSKQYTAVLEQQGRVSLDADANEQQAIQAWLRETEAVDVIGAYGGPVGDEGFAIAVTGGEILIGAGRYYVEGLLCENRQNNLLYEDQPYLLNPSPSDAALLSDLAHLGSAGSIQIFLQVWQRMATPLDDPCLREPALGRADTTTRLQTVWRVVAHLVRPTAVPPKPSGTVAGSALNRFLTARNTLAAAERVSLSSRLLINSLSRTAVTGASFSTAAGAAASVPTAPTTGPVPTTPAPAPPDCCATMYDIAPSLSTGTMTAATSGGNADCSCQPIPAAGYQGLENQLYRVEIHRPGDETTATVKWSRENGSVVAAVQKFSGPTVWVDSLGPDANLGFQANQWVEISDDTNLFGQNPNQPGILYQISSVDPTGPSITLTTTVLPVDHTRNARIRRWDQTGPTASTEGVPLPVGTWLTLENGIQVSFAAGTFQSGDWWTIPARTATGTIDWPPCGSDGNQFQRPHSTKIYNAPLACIHWDTAKRQAVVEDCRRRFYPLTALTPPVTAPALHITAYSWPNDDIISFDQLLKDGLTLTFDQLPTAPVSGASFIVTLESVNLSVFANPNTHSAQSSLFSRVSLESLASVGASTAVPGATTVPATGAGTSATTSSTTTAAGTTTTTGATTVPSAALLEAVNVSSIFTTLYQTFPLMSSILDWQISVDTKSRQIHWHLPTASGRYVELQLRYLQLLNQNLLGAMAVFGLYARARVKLVGSEIFSDAGNTRMYLDGQCVSVSATRTDGKTPALALQVPSGNAEQASNLDGWFYVAPFNGVSIISSNFAAFTVQIDAVGEVTGAVAGIPPTPQKGIITIDLNYPAATPAGVTVDLSLATTTTGVDAGGIVSLEKATLVIPQGAIEGKVGLNFIGNPGARNTFTFQVTASVPLAYGTPIAQSTTFTITGVEAPNNPRLLVLNPNIRE